MANKKTKLKASRYWKLLSVGEGQLSTQLDDFLRAFKKKRPLSGADPFHPDWTRTTPEELNGMAAAVTANVLSDESFVPVSISYKHPSDIMWWDEQWAVDVETEYAALGLSERADDVPFELRLLAERLRHEGGVVLRNYHNKKLHLVYLDHTQAALYALIAQTVAQACNPSPPESMDDEEAEDDVDPPRANGRAWSCTATVGPIGSDPICPAGAVLLRNIRDARDHRVHRDFWMPREVDVARLRLKTGEKVTFIMSLIDSDWYLGPLTRVQPSKAE